MRTRLAMAEAEFSRREITDDQAGWIGSDKFVGAVAERLDGEQSDNEARIQVILYRSHSSSRIWLTRPTMIRVFR